MASSDIVEERSLCRARFGSHLCDNDQQDQGKCNLNPFISGPERLQKRSLIHVRPLRAMSNTVTVENGIAGHFKKTSGGARYGVDWAIGLRQHPREHSCPRKSRSSTRRYRKASVGGQGLR